MHLLTVGRYTYTSDQRFRAIHQPHSEDWTLQLKYPQHRDSGVYECQISSTPHISHFIHLSVIGRKHLIFRKNFSVLEEIEYCIVWQCLRWFFHESSTRSTYHFKSLNSFERITNASSYLVTQLDYSGFDKSLYTMMSNFQYSLITLQYHIWITKFSGYKESRKNLSLPKEELNTAHFWTLNSASISLSQNLYTETRPGIQIKIKPNWM